jgi:hypothetical protein
MRRTFAANGAKLPLTHKPNSFTAKQSRPVAGPGVSKGTELLII